MGGLKKQHREVGCAILSLRKCVSRVFAIKENVIPCEHIKENVYTTEPYCLILIFFIQTKVLFNLVIPAFSSREVMFLPCLSRSVVSEKYII